MKGKGPMRSTTKHQTGAPEAESIAIQALGFLAGDPERLERFLAITGLGPENLRAAAGQPGFFASVLAHVVEDEPLLLAFAADAGIGPERVARAQAVLAGPGQADWDQ
jgi:hypothetical protein